MGLISKVLYLKETKDLIEDGLYNVGANITEYDTFRSYPDIVDDLYNSWPRVTATGESATLDQTMEAPLNIDLKGNTSQTGTPTPSSPIRVNTVNGDNTITIANSDSSESQTYDITLCGKNLFDGEIELGGIDPANGSLVSNNSRTRSKNYTKVKPNTTYTFKREVGENRWIVGYTSSKVGITDGNFNNKASAIRSIGVNDNVMTFTTTSTTEYIKWYDTNSTDLTEEVMLELGSTATSYEAYNTIELCKIGDYQDYIFKNGDKWYLHKEVGKVVLNGSENWYKSGNTSVDRFIIDSFFPTTNKDILSNRYQAIQSLDTSYPKIYNNSTQLVINHGVYGNLTLAQYKTWLSSNNVSVYYILATATDTQITDTNLINQLEQLKGAMSYEGQTNISQVNNDLPFILSAEALKGSAE